MTLETLINLVEQGFIEKDRAISYFCKHNGYSTKNIAQAEQVLYE